MSETPESSSRVRKHTPTAIKQRNPMTALGGLIGALAMSVIAGVLIAVAVTPAVALAGTAAGAAVDLFEELPSHIDPGQQAQPSTLYAKKGGERVPIASFYVQNRIEKKWEDVSQYVKDAAVAVEDPGFYSHGGVNVISAARAALQNAVAGDGPGASTITMQYVRNVLIMEAAAIPDKEESDAAFEEANARTTERKLKEMRLAVSIEKKFTKDEILLGYLNIALFGGQVYGIESASNYFFNKSANDVTLPEAASLIAIVNAPNAYRIDREDNLKANKERRDYILKRMLVHKKITEAQYEEAIETPVEPNITPRASGCSAATEYGVGHFCNYVKLSIENDPSFGNDSTERYFNLARGGYEIDTTLDLDLQEAANNAFLENIPAEYPGFDAGGAAVTSETGTGRILQMSQNRPFSEDPDALERHPSLTPINYNTDFEYGGSSGFQIGSTIKPINLANWLKQGHSLKETVRGDPYTVQESSIKMKCAPGGVYGYSTFPVNNHNGFRYGNRSVLYATAYSINSAFINMTQKTDLCDIVDLAEAMGIKRASDQLDAKLPNYGTRELSRIPSFTYAGTDEIAPLTMSTAYAGFAGKGIVCSPTAIDRITDRDGKEVPFTKNECKQALDPDVAAGVAYALEYTVTNGIAGHARSSTGVPHFAKTGTTNNYWDHWTVGGSTKISTAIWTGNVVGKVDTETSGLPYDGDRVFGMILNAGDALYGGDPFEKPNANALTVKMKNVPNTAGKTVEEATQMLETLGFSVTQGGERDSSVTAGLVAESDPAGGGQAPEGSTITLYTSNGQMSKVPDGIVGQTAKEAEATLRSAGFSSVSTTCGSGDKKKNNSVVESVNPASGADAKNDSNITLSLTCEKSDDEDD